MASCGHIRSGSRLWGSRNTGFMPHPVTTINCGDASRVQVVPHQFVAFLATIQYTGNGTGRGHDPGGERSNIMTYCCGILVRDGLVKIADIRTNAGLDNISVFRKLHTFTNQCERVMAIAASGNLSITRERRHADRPAGSGLRRVCGRTPPSNPNPASPISPICANAGRRRCVPLMPAFRRSPMEPHPTFPRLRARVGWGNVKA